MNITGGRTTAAEYGVREIDVTIIRATNYTDDGYPIRTRVGVIRSNTLMQMGTLTRDLGRYPFFEGITLSVHLVDEAIERVPLKRILRRSRRPGVKTIVMIAGVQTNQFPRAQDIASWFLPHGIQVLIGGFHVSGMLAMIGLTSDLRKAMSDGIILVAGEVEGDRLPRVVEDVIRGEPEPLYNFLNPTPDLGMLPTPRLSRKDVRKFASPFSTIDSGRGCVFTCDFCTIINVQGRVMRFRAPEQIVEFARRSHREAGVSHCFFTDDNLARNPRWRELFAGLIGLREEEKIPFTFMMQSDLAARKLPGGDFFILASRAGCNQVFFGVESVNRQNLRSQAKFQNQVSEYKDLVAHCHSLGIACHAGYILGLPYDTASSIQQDVGELQRMGFDSVSFYIMTPLPGSADHQRWWRERRWLDPDFNTYDSAHVSVVPERMAREELQTAYHNAWTQFYSTDHMIEILKTWRHNHRFYWDRIFFFAWYLYASGTERLHPMNCGFWTRRRRRERRPGYPREAALAFWWHQLSSTMTRLRGMAQLFFQLEEVWLRSRPRSRIEEVIEEVVRKSRQGAMDWRELKSKELVEIYTQLHEQWGDVRIPSVLTLWLKKHNPFAPAYSRAYARHIWRRWYLHIWNPLKWIEVWLFEGIHGTRFLTGLFVQGR